MTNLSLISEKQTSTFFSKSWLIWGCAALFYGYQFMLRVSPGVMAEDLMASFEVDACSLGILTSCYYIAYTLLQIPVGTLMDRFKPRRMITFAAVCCSLGALLFSSADALYVAGIGRALIGAGSAFAFLSCLKLGTLWFPSHKLPIVVGMTLLLGTIGGVSAGYPMGWLVEVSGWRHSMWLVAFVGFALAALGWAVVRDKAPQALEKEILKSHGEDKTHTSESGLLTSIIEVMRKPQSWFIALYGFLMYVPLSGFADQWGPHFFISVYKFDKSIAGAINSALLLGIGVGAPLFPLLCKYLKAYKPAVLIAALGALISLSIVLYVPNLPVWLLISLLFLTGFFLGGQFLAFSMTCALNPLSASATAGGFHNMICMLSGVIFQPFIGRLLDYSWKGGYVNGIRAYTESDYMIALSSISISLILACCVVFLIKEKY
ncbi:MAG TPA: MFS transporter [Alphaproteobacteria bacterium]|nr:MFS transporter [Alphaproteobacteria bacterium]